ncbi:hypothetical protein [Rhodanobacter sp. C03]|uniref:hypothetical protein n=1 Tax=Rhodanobacter sp. C03 TaxID=1945858 RepID=UPI000985C3C8|nr:hypothetical protein [Rhodanobacter sp. C03]OOG56408.1 hypothetical protein B0E48_09665 [Rhodanobacter sp. C03]
MSRNRRKITGRAESGGYFTQPHAVMESPNYRALSAHAVKLLNDLGLQFRGANNGDLSTAWRIMQPRGWRSRDTLWRAQAELLHFGMIEKTRQGGLNRCNLFALTWLAINECRNKLDVPATRVASGVWNTPQPPMPKPERKNATSNTTSVSDRHGGRVSTTCLACQ